MPPVKKQLLIYNFVDLSYEEFSFTDGLVLKQKFYYDANTNCPEF